MPSDHGIDPAIALTSDCVINANIHTFGTCSCRADLDDSQYRPNLNNGWLQGEEGDVQIDGTVKKINLETLHMI